MNSVRNERGEKDIWYRWLQGRRDGGDVQRREETLRKLAPIRDKVLENARLKNEEVLLDVGCGDGLIGFGALEATPSCRVIFSDISTDLLDYCRGVVRDTDHTDRCRFEPLSADNLDTIEDESIDVVTTRSVLIYVPDKEKAFREFHRVLKPRGRLSIFEPINRFGYESRKSEYFGYDMSPVIDLYGKVRTAFAPNGTDSGAGEITSNPMIDFDERDLMALAERAGFRQIALEYHAAIHPCTPDSWDFIYRMAPNPNAPTLEEAVQRTLGEQEAEEFIAYLKPLVDRGEGTRKMALAYLHAVK